MTRSFVRPLAAGSLGAFAGAAWLVLAYVVSPGFSVPFDRTAPPSATGFYPPERNERGAFAWTGPEARLVLDRLDRRVEWVCTVGVRGARPDPADLPAVAFAVDGRVADRRMATNEFVRVSVPIPARPERPGAVLSISTSAVFAPGSGDPRRLGVMVNELACRPSHNQMVLPPGDSLGLAALSTGLLGAGLGAIGITPGSAIGAAALLGAAQAGPLTTGTTPYTPFPHQAAILAACIALGLVIGVSAADRTRAVRLRHTARFAAAFSACVLYLQLLVLLHPERAAGAVPATGLAAAHPWTAAILVAAAAVLAGLFLYELVNLVWSDRLAAASTVGFHNLVPLGFAVQARGDLGASLAQSAGVVAIVCLTAAGPGAAAPRLVAAGSLLLASALLIHPGVGIVIFATVVLAAAFWALRGVDHAGGRLRPALVSVTLAAALAAALLFVTGGNGGGPRLVALDYPAGGTAWFGWPILLLACVGAWRVVRTGLRDRLSVALLGWLAACLAFLLVGRAAGIRLSYELVACPAFATLAAVATGWAWRRGGTFRYVIAGLNAWAVWVAAASWASWLR